MESTLIVSERPQWDDWVHQLQICKVPHLWKVLESTVTTPAKDSTCKYPSKYKTCYIRKLGGGAVRVSAIPWTGLVNLPDLIYCEWVGGGGWEQAVRYRQPGSPSEQVPSNLIWRKLFNNNYLVF
jgi:hypothetical protein